MNTPESYIGKVVYYGRTDSLVQVHSTIVYSTIFGIIIGVEKIRGDHLRREAVKESTIKKAKEEGRTRIGSNNVQVIEENGERKLWAWTRPVIYKFYIRPIKEIQDFVRPSKETQKYWELSSRLVIKKASNYNDVVTCYYGSVKLGKPGEELDDTVLRVFNRLSHGKKA